MDIEAIKKQWNLKDPLTGQFPISPEDIDVSNHFFDSFEHMETEVSAWWLVRFAQHRGQGWTPFTDTEINMFYRDQGTSKQRNFRFNRLVRPEMVSPNLARAFAGFVDTKVPKGGGWIIQSDDGLYHFTPDVIIRCFRSSLR